MSWLLHGERLETADMVAPFRVYMPFSISALGANWKLKAVRSWFIFYNNPSFTSIEMRLYSSRNGEPQKLLNTTNAVLKAEIMTLNNAAKEIGFKFEYAESLDADREVILLPYINGYTGTESSHIAWRRAYEDSVYIDGVSQVYKNLLVRPFQIALIGEQVK